MGKIFFVLRKKGYLSCENNNNAWSLEFSILLSKTLNLNQNDGTFYSYTHKIAGTLPKKPRYFPVEKFLIYASKKHVYSGCLI